MTDKLSPGFPHSSHSTTPESAPDEWQPRAAAEYAPCRRCGRLKDIGEWCTCATSEERAAVDRYQRGEEPSSFGEGTGSTAEAKGGNVGEFSEEAQNRALAQLIFRLHDEGKAKEAYREIERVSGARGMSLERAVQLHNLGYRTLEELEAWEERVNQSLAEAAERDEPQAQGEVLPALSEEDAHKLREWARGKDGMLGG